MTQRRIAVTPGDRFGRLTVLAEDRLPLPSRPAHNQRVALVRCDCGATKHVRLASLASGHIVSCGCWNAELLRSPENLAHLTELGRSPENLARLANIKRPVKHGFGSHPLYKGWAAMLARCENPAAHNYRWYGARGIKVCPQWHDVATFIIWIEANLGPRPDGMTLDRIDSDGNYEPGNVRWATPAEQNRNKRASAARVDEMLRRARGEYEAGQ